MSGRESIQTMGNTGMKRSTASVAQRRFPPLSGSASARRLLIRRSASATVALAGLAICILASGCRSGVTSLSAPKWWAFGDAKSANAKNFSSAPAFGGSAATASADSTIKKPSEVATAYPTTSTPNGYAMAGSAPAASAAAAAVIPAATAEPSAVTYGVTPTRSQSMPAVTSQVASTTLDPSVPQMGRYESMPAPPAPAAAAPPPGASGFAAGYPAPAAASADPAATATAGLAPAPSAFPATAGYEPVRERLAENRSIDALGPAAAVAAANPGLAPVAQSPLAEPAPSSGYRNISGSRFAGGGTPALPAVAATAPLIPPPVAIPPAAATPPAATPPAAWTPPAAAPGGPAATPAVAPPRRPDPVYRPAGTSSYKPSEQILVDDPPALPSAVRTAGYETPFQAAPYDPQPIDQ